MWNLTNVSILNFKSIGDCEINFQINEPHIINGVNLDDPGANSNGSGKTSLMEAILVGLIGIPDKTILKKDYVRDNQKSSQIRITLVNNVNNSVLEIIRTIKVKSSNKCELIIDGEEDTEQYSESEANKEIARLIGVEPEKIMKFFIVRFDESSFFSLTNTEKIKILGDFANIDKVDKMIDSIKKDKESKEEQIKNFEEKIMLINSEIESKEKVIGDLKSTPDIREIIKEFNDNITNLSKKIRIEKSKLKEVDEEELKDLKSIKLTLIRSIEEYEYKINANKKEKRRLDLKLSGFIECPACSHKFSLKDKTESIKDVEIAITANEKNRASLSESKLEIENLLKETKNRIKQFQSSIEFNEEIQDNIRYYNKRIKTYKDRINDHNSSAPNNSLIQNYQKELEELKSSLNRNKKSLKRVKDEYQNLEKLEFVFNKQYKYHLLGKSLQILESKCNEYLRIFKMNMNIRLNGFKVLASGEVREKINEVVERNGQNYAFGKLSKGQKTRLNICMIFAFNDLINQTSPQGGLNLLGLDEVFEGLDQKGQERTLSMFNNVMKTSLIISHQNYEVGAVNPIKCIYQNGITNVQTSKKESS